MERLPVQIADAQIACALRFDGYADLSHEIATETTQPEGDTRLTMWIDPVAHSLTVPSDDNRNFAALFGLQRRLFK